jgi:multidrug efflux pump subunit AcrA (membrane-fusion protein)
MRIHSRLTTAIAVVALASLGGCAKSLPGGGGSLPSGTVPGGLAGASGEAKPVVYQTEHAEIADITKTTVTIGSIVPRREVEVKPKVTGVLSELYVEPGKVVKMGDALGKISIIREGSTRGQDKSSTLIVTATIPGMVIDVPVKVGYSVIPATNFNPGTTVAVIADMADMIFDGQVAEAEVGKIREGMRLAIKVDAIEKDKLEGKLEYISPKGKLIDGVIQFEIKAAVKQQDGIQIRANYSASADIVLDEKKQVLAVRETVVQYDNAKPFVEIETTPQTFAKTDVKLGLSDGIKVEVLDGVTRADKIKIPDNAGPVKPMMCSCSAAGSKPPAKK